MRVLASLLAASLLVALASVAARAQEPQMPPSAAYIEKRVGSDALTIAQLLDRLAAAEAKSRELQAELDKLKAGDAAPKDGKP